MLNHRVDQMCRIILFLNNSFETKNSLLFKISSEIMEEYIPKILYFLYSTNHVFGGEEEDCIKKQTFLQLANLKKIRILPASVIL